MMKEFALLFRQATYGLNDVPPLEMQAITKKWEDWKGQLEAQGKLASHGQRLSIDGKVLKAGGVVTDGPFVEIRERLAGFLVVKAGNLDEATTLAHGCPVLDTGGSVEIRELL